MSNWKPIELSTESDTVTIIKTTKHCLNSDLMVGDKLIYKNNSELTATIHDLTDDGFVLIDVIVLGKKELAKHTVREIDLLFDRERTEPIVFSEPWSELL